MMKPRQLLCGLLAVLVSVSMGALTATADSKPVIPNDLKGFAGTLTGTVVSVQTNGLGFVLKVTAATPGDASKATNPQSAVGLSLLINVHYEKGSDGKYHPVDTQVAFVKALAAGQTTGVNVVNDEGSRLHIVSIPTAPATKPASN